MGTGLNKTTVSSRIVTVRSRRKQKRAALVVAGEVADGRRAIPDEGGGP
jgi:hypothetical protein